ncbi:Glucuronyl hydrolase [Indibacter alkaliphilus LW1]|uniref:Glucuronyl hydrolase n=1 Tax=Indibacter alkaliphilus (strain CCUG 57479 / KCTC 22604 / LW1) TaxID=1189612 RepID=S2E6B0_INDAL|nr:glycoside hydrolase family 88 protein [Indibacter alkaliphilus]EOZ97813.1 Glucuronyl hydrolase [Indibacter alkaliphilus LW1]
MEVKKTIKKWPNFKVLSFSLFILIMTGAWFEFKVRAQVPKEDVIRHASNQYQQLTRWAKENGKIPRSVENGIIRPIYKGFDWTAGFFPGSLWYLYELTRDDKWAEDARYFKDMLSDMRFFSGSHDLGFIFNNSYGHAYRLHNRSEDLDVLLDAGNTLIQRFNPTVGAIQSWDIDRGWQSQRGWSFPVIIDNMMNLELLFRLSEWTGDSKYAEVAIAHANTTMDNFFRNDYSSYHVVDFDPSTGKPLAFQTAQGYSDDSSWARGQAWGLYGFISVYAFTFDKKYLELAEKIAQYYLNHTHIPEDNIPHWDMSLYPSSEVPRDASAAAIVASALFQLDNFSTIDYRKKAEEILESLSSEKYLAENGANHNFLIKHCTGSIPHNEEIDVPLNYADYYFLEALYRHKKL